MNKPMNNPVVRKIAKLLRLAEAQAGEHEGMTAARVAANLMAAHGIDQEAVDLDDVRATDPMGQTNIEAPATSWHRRLSSAITAHCGCFATYIVGGRKITFYGLESDRAVATYLFHLCARQIDAAAREWVAAESYKYNKTPREVGRIFRYSAVQGLEAKLREIQEETREATPAYGLVLARAPQAAAFAKDVCGSIRGHKTRMDHRLQAGYDAGRNVSLRAGVTSADVDETKQLGG